jgi:hypothetical protein
MNSLFIRQVDFWQECGWMSEQDRSQNAALAWSKKPCEACENGARLDM